MIYLFVLLRVLDLLTTYIGISLGVSEGNFLQALLMTLGPLYYPLNLLVSILLYKLISKLKVGKLVLSLFLIINGLVVLSNLFCIVLAIR